jgi:hypothetical protein
MAGQNKETSITQELGIEVRFDLPLIDLLGRNLEWLSAQGEVLFEVNFAELEEARFPE